MNKNKKAMLGIGVVGFAALALAVAIAPADLAPRGFAFASGEHTASCQWNHYSAVAPTDSAHGSREFWACCTHARNFSLTLPESTHITDKGAFSGEAFDALTDEDDRYLSPIRDLTATTGKYAYVDLSASNVGTLADLDIDDVSGYVNKTTTEYHIDSYNGAVISDFRNLSAGVHTLYTVRSDRPTVEKISLLVATKLVKTESDLNSIRGNGTDAITGYYVLRQNIYLGSTAFTASYGWGANSGFQGTFDGANHYLEHMVVGLGGLFGTLCGTVKNVEFRNFLIGGGWGQSVLAYNSYWAAIDNVKVSVSDNWTAARDAYGMIIGNQVQNLTLKNSEFDFESDVGAFYEVSGGGTMKFGYAISKSATFANAIENTTVKIHPAFTNICGENDKSTLPASQPGLKVVSTLYFQSKSYFNSGNSNENVYVYAWNGSDETVKNGNWPGEAMTWVRDDSDGQKIWKYELSTRFTKIIIAKTVDGSSTYQTKDLDGSVLHSNTNNCIWIANEWEANIQNNVINNCGWYTL